MVMNCMKCGDCQAVCPTFAVTGDESAVARGRIRLIKAFEDGELELTDTLVDKINSCMMCMACTASCPSGVNVSDIIISARKRIAEEKGLPTYKKIINEALKHPALMSLASRLAPVYSHFFDIVPESSSRTFKKTKLKIENPRMRVALFAGCMVNYAYLEIGDAALNVLAENGIEVVMEKEVCCGAPALFCGDEKTAKRLAEENVKAFSGLKVDAIVMCCPTCENVMKGYPALLENDAEAIEVAEKVSSISQFLAESGFRSGKVEGQIAYHGPCHLKYGAGTDGELQIIASLDKGGVKELEGCCGFAGMFSVSYPDLSRKLNDKKIDEIETTGAGTVVTGCPGCKMYIEKGLKQRGVNCRVVHTVELLNEAYK